MDSSVHHYDPLWPIVLSVKTYMMDRAEWPDGTPHYCRVWALYYYCHPTRAALGITPPSINFHHEWRRVSSKSHEWWKLIRGSVILKDARVKGGSNTITTVTSPKKSKFENQCCPTGMYCDITTRWRGKHWVLHSRVSTFITSGDESAQRATSDESWYEGLQNPVIPELSLVVIPLLLFIL